MRIPCKIVFYRITKRAEAGKKQLDSYLLFPYPSTADVQFQLVMSSYRFRCSFCLKKFSSL